MIRIYGRAVGKARVRDSAPLNCGKSAGIVSAIRRDEGTARMVYEGAMTWQLFLRYAREVLVPTLRPGDIVVMDNLSSHKVKGVVEEIEAARAFVEYLPPYSPDLNPIEQMLSKVKAYLRKVKARESGRLRETIEEAFGMMTAENCAGWFVCAGYGGVGQSFGKVLQYRVRYGLNMTGKTVITLPFYGRAAPQPGKAVPPPFVPANHRFDVPPPMFQSSGF